MAFREATVLEAMEVLGLCLPGIPKADRRATWLGLEDSPPRPRVGAQLDEAIVAAVVEATQPKT